MKLGHLWLIGGVALLLAACSDSASMLDADASSGGAGAGAGSHASAGAGSHAGTGGAQAAGTGGRSSDGGPNDDPTCREREERASSAVADALQTADQRCETTADCEDVSISTLCHAACGFLLGPAGKAAIEAVIAEQNATTCADFEADGCLLIIPPCEPPSPFDCVAGRCTTQGAEPEPGCIEQGVSWGSNGGFVAFQETNTLAPCREFSIGRESFGDPGSDASCANEVAVDADVTADDIDAALANADVQAALADAPVLYGSDPRAFDGSVFRITQGGAIVELGGDCGGSASGCVEVPAGLAALRDVLQRLTEQQRALPDCTALP